MRYDAYRVILNLNDEKVFFGIIKEKILEVT